MGVLILAFLVLWIVFAVRKRKKNGGGCGCGCPGCTKGNAPCKNEHAPPLPCIGFGQGRRFFMGEYLRRNGRLLLAALVIVLFCAALPGCLRQVRQSKRGHGGSASARREKSLSETQASRLCKAMMRCMWETETRRSST